jgi:type IV pilus assembly protein PilV
MKSLLRFSRGSRRQAGVTLLEVLIAVLVLALGLLGMAGLQMSALRNNQSSMERSMAVVESYSIADAMRIDRVNAIAGAFNLAIDAEPAGTTFAANELAKWRARLRANLGPDASGSVACNATACDIVVRWNDVRGTAGEEQQEITTEVQI